MVNPNLERFGQMKISVTSTAQAINIKALINKSAVMFDILRASSTVSTALANGCKEVIPVMEVEEAFGIARTLPDNTFLLGGERGAVKVPGFHLGNSPLEYGAEVVTGKTVILTTTNGTKALVRAAEGSDEVLIGSLLNATAVAKKLLDLEKDIALICAGTRGNFSLEDTLAAGMVIKEIVRLWQEKGLNLSAHSSSRTVNDGVYLDEVPIISGNSLVLEDAAVAALRLAEVYQTDTLRALYDSLHGQKLAQMGLVNDLAYCAQVDLFSVVPVYRHGKVILE